MAFLKDNFAKLLRLIGGLSIFYGKVILQLFNPKAYSFREILNFTWKLGGEIIFIIILAGLGSGIGTTMQSSYVLELIGLKESDIGSTSTTTLVKGLIPLTTSIFAAMRMGTAITAELGIMKVTEQIDALKMAAIDPIRMLVFPKFIGAALMFPIINVIAIYFGVLGAFIASVFGMHVHPLNFQQSMGDMLEVKDVWAFVIKTMAFGIIVAVSSCYFGLTTEGGSVGVGRSVTKAIVFIIVLIFIANFIVASVFG